MQAELENIEEFKPLFIVLNSLVFKMACEQEEAGHCGAFNQLALRYKIIIIANLKIYYAKFEGVMNEEAGCTEQKERYRVRSNQAWKQWMELGGLVRTMLTCRGSDEKMDNIPHFTKQMQVYLSQKLLIPEGSLAPSDRMDIMKWTAASARKQIVDEMVKEWEVMWACRKQFRDVSEDVLARWCYKLWRVCGFNLASAVKKMQHWFQARRKIWEKKNCKKNPVSASAEEKNDKKSSASSEKKNDKKRKHAGDHPANSQGGHQDSDLVAQMLAKAKNGDPAALEYLAAYYSNLAARANATKPSGVVVPLLKSPKSMQTTPLKTQLQITPNGGEVWGYGDFADKDGGLLARITVLDGDPDTASIKSVQIGTCVWVEPFYFTHTPLRFCHYR